MATSGGLGCLESDLRMDYYDMSGIPHILWDGVVEQVGADAEDADGEEFAAIVVDRLATDAPLAVSVMSYNFSDPEPYITVRIEIFADLPTTADTYLRVGICENGLTYSGTRGSHTPDEDLFTNSANHVGSEYYNVLRDMPADTPLTVMTAGQVQEVTLPLVIDGDWDRTALWAFAFVQRDSDKLIYNAGSTFVTPYTLSVDVDGTQQAVIADPYVFGETTITSMGAASDHTVDISLDTSSLPEGWNAYITIGGEDLTFTTVTLGQFETADLTVTMIPTADAGSGRAVLNLHSHSGEMPDIDVHYVGVVAGAYILIVADDGGADYAYDFFVPAIVTADKSHAIWEHALAVPTAETLAAHDLVVWQTGNRTGGLPPADRAVIENYLAAGGRFFLSGENVVEGICGDDALWSAFNLRVAYRNTEQGSPEAAGVAGDPISTGLVLDLMGGDGAGNYDDPDVIEPFNGGGGIQCFFYDADSGAGVRAEYGGAKVLTLGFGFESIDDAADRDLLMQRVVDWMATGVIGVNPGGELPPTAMLYQNAPNPFNPQTTIPFDLNRQTRVQLAVYDVTGRLVRVLANEVLAAGEHSLVWDGRDLAGDQVAAGAYVYRLISDGHAFSRKMTVLK